MKKKAFTLAEIMIALTVIGVLTAILLPAAFHATPDENVMKFKKANSTLGTVIRKLVNSDEYYSGGDLGIRADGTLLDGTHNGDTTYFCETFADTLNAKEKNCSSLPSVYPEAKTAFLNIYGENEDMYGSGGKTMKQAIDDSCKYNDAGKIREIVIGDGIVIYQVWPNTPFGKNTPEGTVCYDTVENCKLRIFKRKTPKGFLQNYKVICIDVDGVPEDATVDNCINECPFGWGIRTDGKLLPGKRADEWIQKSMQKD